MEEGEEIHSFFIKLILLIAINLVVGKIIEILRR